MSYLPHVVLVFAALIAAGRAQGEAPGPSETPIAVATVPFGARTRGWLAFQRQIVPERQAHPLPVEAESRAFERYLQSFTHPIPERFELDRLEVNQR
jgi:hypothetical protein